MKRLQLISAHVKTSPRFRILVCLVALFALTSCGGGSSSAGSGGGNNPDGFSAIFGQTFANSRCQNCHAYDAGNTIREIHERTGRAQRDCAECHFTPGWRAPFRSFSFTGVSDTEICLGIKARSGNDLNVLREELIGSTLARWAIEDGGVPVVDDNENITDEIRQRPTAPPGSMAELGQLFERWIAGGAICD